LVNVISSSAECVSATDRGLSYGDGLFETIRMEGDRAVLLSRHLQRMVADAAVLGIVVTESELRDAVRVAVATHAGTFSSGSWVLKLVLTRGSGGRGYRPAAEGVPNLVVSASAMPPLPGPEGVAAGLSDFPLTVNPRLAGIKTLNRLEQVMASRELTDELYELVMCGADGRLVEGTRTNVLMKLSDRWVTPPREQLAVAGVMRGHVMDYLVHQGEAVEYSTIPLSMLRDAGCQGLYLMNSVMGIVPVRKFDDLDLPVNDALATIFNPLDLVEV